MIQVCQVDLDDVIVEIIHAHAPIKFDALLRAMEKRVGYNNVTESTLQRRLKGLRLRDRIKHKCLSPRGWIITDDKHITRNATTEPANNAAV